MSEDPIQNPHDQLFKEAFTHIETAAGFFQSYLPADIRSRLDWKWGEGSSLAILHLNYSRPQEWRMRLMPIRVEVG